MSFTLAHQVLEGSAARGLALFLHGILGQGANWRSTAQRLTQRGTGWGAVLVDLRLHGRSRDAPPPHTLASATDDVVRLIDELAGRGAPVRALVGHSFGGKVALAVRARAPAELAATAVFDASPSARAASEFEPTPGSVAAVIRALGQVPRRYRKRDDLVTALAERGIDAPIGRWLAMSLVADGDGYALPFDQAGVQDMLTSYLATDLWRAVEDPALPGSLTFYLAGRSDTVSTTDRARLAALAPRVATKEFPAADHWMLGERDALELPPL